MSHDQTTACAVLVALAFCSGCRVLSLRPKSPQLEGVPSATANVDTGVVRTGFNTEPSPEQALGVHLALARAQEAQGADEAAVIAYQKALDASAKLGRGKGVAQSQALAHRKMAAALDRLGRFAQAETRYKAAARLSPNDPKVWNDSGYSLYLQGRYTEAEQALRTAVKLAPTDARIQTNLGMALAAQGRTDAALEAFTRASSPSAAHANLGYLLAATGQVEAARDHFEQALQHQPDLKTAQAALVQLNTPMRRPTSRLPYGTGTEVLGVSDEPGGPRAAMLSR